MDERGFVRNLGETNIRVHFMRKSKSSMERSHDTIPSHHQPGSLAPPTALLLV
ncbi:predicted protein [Uncinocarpus reesii 1704]|uniref:Uncharacterized protein n=1 Tax=Uncinocarpus reesii (strain UAMH 1704) TaxID=336963 RepID=C4JHR4_UNCRE|nr:uncharacterized protein UREG_02750 [Uncinocarpus reesii 1704]EEP77901.1 predicted protein [Uncinocarpus reesii 1704]